MRCASYRILTSNAAPYLQVAADGHACRLTQNQAPNLQREIVERGDILQGEGRLQRRAVADAQALDPPALGQRKTAVSENEVVPLTMRVCVLVERRAEESVEVRRRVGSIQMVRDCAEVT